MISMALVFFFPRCHSIVLINDLKRKSCYCVNKEDVNGLYCIMLKAKIKDDRVCRINTYIATNFYAIRDMLFNKNQNSIFGRLDRGFDDLEF